MSKSSDQFEISGLPETLIMLGELDGVILWIVLDVFYTL